MQQGTYRIIPVKAKDRTVFALVSPEDYEGIGQSKWRLHKQGYAVRYGLRPGETFLMHREILGLVKGDGLEGDHVNFDRLDNRRSNLRAVSHADNGRHVRSQGGSSRHRGVCWYKSRSRWRSGARYEGRNHHLGYFFDEDEAAAAVNTFWVERGYPAPNLISA